MSNTQSNTKVGPLIFPAGEALTDYEGRLVKLVDAGSFAEVKLPEAVSDLALYVLDQGGADEADVEIIPLEPGRNIRVRLNGTVSAGAPVVLEAISGANIGKVRAVPATEGVYFSPGVAEEDGADEQLLKIRPFPRLIHVGTAFTVATPAATAATSSTPFGYSEAQANAILTTVRELRAWAVAQGFKATS